ncbi:MAG: DUF2207 domain-containing protein [Pseudolabrys sp.]|nr:DUF2207 domain-containing protein [Pseudolabrys sp.]MDP2295847.1 DUF2207 domain-containing protein [Pseudolabrys sp.]
MHGLLRSVCLGIAIITTFAGGAAAAEVIHKFESAVQLAKDGTLTVTETVRVRAEGRAIKRGIYRDFPMTFTDAGGREREVDFTLLGVTRDGKPEPHHTERQQRYLRIYAGDKDVTLTTGDHTYVFRYRTARQVRWFDGQPELNWNVTGNFWNFPILSAAYRLELIAGERPLRWTAFSGPLGAQGKDWRGAIGDAGVLAVETTRPLAAGEGLTVVAGLAFSAVDPPNEQWYAIVDNRHWIFGSIGFVLVLLYYVAAWRAVGRDPRRGTIIPLFHPPAGVSPALANYIDNWGFGRDRWRAFTAAALSLAVRGLITFDQSGDTLTLTAKRKSAAGEVLPPGERAIYDWVQKRDGKAIIDKEHGAAVVAAGNAFTAAIEAESKNKFFRRNLGYAIAGVVMTIAVVVGVLIVGGLQENDIGVLIVSTMGSFFLAVFIIPVLTALFGGGGLRSIFRSLLSLAVFAIFISIFVGLITTIIPDEPVDLSPLLTFVRDYPFSFVLLSAFATLNGLFFYLMRAPTALGRPIMDQLAGLRLYIETAETDRLNREVPDITAERFEALLPYAVALNLEKPWSDAFAAALRRAHPDEADPMQHYHPAWTGGGRGWSGANFGTAVAATVGGVSSALASAVPVSSGSSGFSSGGGGGSSGGGGGGGGGGGW